VSHRASTVAPHIHDLHAEIRRQISLSNDSYKHSVDMHRRAANFEVGDFVMARIRPERLPRNSLKKFHARAMGPYQILRKLGSNAYVLNLPDSLGISPIFNVEDLTLHRGTFELPCLPFGVSASTQVPRLPPLPQSQTNIEAMLDDKFVSSSRGGFRRFLVQWSGRLQSDATWITEDEFREMNPTLLEWYLQDNSSALSSFSVGENDVVSPKEFYGNVYSRKNRRFRNLGIVF